MRKLGVIAACLFMLFAVVSCDDDCVCDDFLLKVIVPDQDIGFSQDFAVINEHVVVEVVFNHPVDVGSVVDGQTLIMKSTENVAIPTTFTFNPAKTVMVVATTGIVGDFCVFNPDCGFYLELVGSDVGNGAILDANGNTLDGDDDDVEGGNYKLNMGIIG